MANGGCHPETPEVWESRCRMRTFSFPFAANSGQ